MIGCHHRLTRWGRTITAAGLMPLFVVTSLPACATLVYRSSVRTASAESQPMAAQSLLDWTRVEAMRVGTPVRVHLYEGKTFPDDRQITGLFHAATADSLTLTLDDGQTRTLARLTVHMVHAPRPIWKRYAGWLSLACVITGFAILGLHPDNSTGAAIGGGVFYGLLASIPGFTKQRTQRIYEAPPARLITQVRVPSTDSDIVPRHESVTVSVAHASRLSRLPTEPIGLTVCLSSRPDRCTGGWAVFEGLAGRLADPVTATLRFGDETVPLDTPISVYVHVVLTSGPSWRPALDQEVPQLGDPHVLDVETVTWRVTIVDQ